MYTIKSRLSKVNYTLIMTVFLISLLSLFVSYHNQSDQTEYYKRFFFFHHFKRLLIGFICFTYFSLLDYRKLKNYASAIYWVCIVFLIITLFSKLIGGVNRWFRIPLIGITIQPSEFTKLGILILLCDFVDTHKHISHGLYPIIVGILAVPILLILRQPDLGSALIILIMSFTILYPSLQLKKRTLSIYKWSILIVTLSIIIFPKQISKNILPLVLKDYQIERFNLNDYHHKMAIKAIKNGQLLGYSDMINSLSKTGQLPEANTDSIYATYVETVGIAGSLILCLLYCLLVIIGYTTFCRTHNTFGAMISFGITTYTIIHCFINMGMMIGWLPITGVPLPFLSYGGSTTIVSFSCYGILHSVYLNKY